MVLLQEWWERMLHDSITCYLTLRCILVVFRWICPVFLVAIHFTYILFSPFKVIFVSIFPLFSSSRHNFIMRLCVMKLGHSGVKVVTSVHSLISIHIRSCDRLSPNYCLILYWRIQTLHKTNVDNYQTQPNELIVIINF